MEELRKLPGHSDSAALQKVCAEAVHNENCRSEKGLPIFHWNRKGTTAATTAPQQQKPLKILVFGMIHGDEPWSGSLARLWAERLTRFDPRNEWRILPILNPDGWRLKTRMNSRQVDLNRNFPTKDWAAEAVQHWAKSSGKNKRRFPGPSAGSEKETLCSIWQIEDFQPDFVISVHTPYGVMDFDGPKSRAPSATPLPWRRLGNYPGSLGRYLWKERGTPVLTVELVHREPAFSNERYARLQDELSDFARKTVDELERSRSPNLAATP